MPISIYSLMDPRDGSIKYVGATKNPLKQRLSNHLNEKGDTRKCHWIAKLKSLGLRPTITLLNRTTFSAYSEVEWAWITKFQEQGFDLLNHPERRRAGGGICELALTTRQIIAQKASVRLKGKPFSGKLTPEIIAANARVNIGRKHSASTRAKMAASQKGKKLGYKHTEETRAKMAEAGKKKVFTEDHKANISTGQKASIVFNSAETRAKMARGAANAGKKNKGKKHTAEHIAKMLAAKASVKEARLLAVQI